MVRSELTQVGGLALIYSLAFLTGSGDGRVSFLNDVQPILTRAGCNQGACHGQQFGKGGFKLSLAAYDPEADWRSILREQGGRRVALREPMASLLLRKPALMLPHAGGLRLPRESEDYRTLVRWLQQGAPGPDPRDPRVTGLVVSPARSVLSPGAGIQLRIAARYGDGSTRDVTRHARINTLNEFVATATPDGRVAAVGRGAAAVMVRYDGLATVAYVDVPYRRSLKPGAISPKRRRDSLSPSHKRSDPAARSTPKGQRLTRDSRHERSNLAASSTPKAQRLTLDSLVERRWTEMGLTPSPLCSDSEFIRRASLDLIGTLPSPAEVRAFLSDSRSDRRARLVDSLLERPEYADYWALRWADLLRSTRSALGGKAQAALNAWLRESFAENKPFDQFVRELITAEGPAQTNGPANYYRVASTPQDLTEATAQLFLGIRLQCAKCHHHPFEKWSQRDYYQFAAYFARVGPAGGKTPESEQTIRLLPAGEVTHPKTGEVMNPTPLDIDFRMTPFNLRFSHLPTPIAHPAPNGEPPSKTPLNWGAGGPDRGAAGPLLAGGLDRREALAAWLTSPTNPAFARMAVNRYWGAVMGRGIVHPVDDVRVTNPPSNPALLDALAGAFVSSGCDVKALLRAICCSRVYQLSARTTPANRSDEVFYSHYLSKRQPAEVMLDSLSRAAGACEKFPGLPAGTRAIQLPDPAVASMFLDTFGRPARSSACECERAAEPSLTQALQMLNGDSVNRLIADPNGRAARIAASKMTDGQIVDELYLAALSRLPRPAEQREALAAIKSRGRLQGAQDLLWALANTREFAYIR